MAILASAVGSFEVVKQSHYIIPKEHKGFVAFGGDFLAGHYGLDISDLKCTEALKLESYIYVVETQLYKTG